MNEHLLSDAEVARFLVTGYHLVEPELPAGLNESVAAQLDTLAYNPGDAITEAVPELWQVLDHPAVKGALVSLLGPDYEVQSHRHWHCKQPNSPHMNWHQDGLNNRDVLLNRFLGLYYPTDVTPDMGPTIIVPGTQFRNAPTDRMATYTNIRGQVPLVVKAGTVAFTHYDLWHGTAANRSPHKRHMIKFLFRRTQDNTSHPLGTTTQRRPTSPPTGTSATKPKTSPTSSTSPIRWASPRATTTRNAPSAAKTGTTSWAYRPNPESIP